MSKTLVLILGDQLSRDISALSGMEQNRTIVLMAEVAEEATYVRHHKKKIAFILSAMRHFADELHDAGWQVDYVRLTDPDNIGSFSGNSTARSGDIGLTAFRSPNRGNSGFAKQWKIGPHSSGYR